MIIWKGFPSNSTLVWVGRGITPFRGLTITMVINHFLNGMILQVVINGVLTPINARKNTGN